jgi:hypothetical protein
LIELFFSIKNFFGPLFLFAFLDVPNNNDSEVKVFAANSAETFFNIPVPFVTLIATVKLKGSI